MEGVRDPRPVPREKGAADEVRVARSPTRCPCCHADVAPDPAAWVACGGCLARHHTRCWDEGARCGGCGGGTRLAVVTPARPSDEALVELLRAGRSADVIAALRASGLDAHAAVTEAARLAFATLETDGLAAGSRAGATGRLALGAQAIGLTVAGASLLGVVHPPGAQAVLWLGLIVGCGGGGLLPISAALLGRERPRRMIAQALFASVSFVVVAAMVLLGADGSVDRAASSGAIALTLACVAGWAAWATPARGARERPAADGPVEKKPPAAPPHREGAGDHA